MIPSLVLLPYARTYSEIGKKHTDNSNEILQVKFSPPASISIPGPEALANSDAIRQLANFFYSDFTRMSTISSQEDPQAIISV